MKLLNLLLTVPLLMILAFGARAELQDQGLSSIMQIIDTALVGINPENGAELSPADLQNAIDTVINLSRTLGTLSYSRLQCGEAAVLAEFTRRVQSMPEERQDSMRDAFQEGFDKSKQNTELLSRDECQRLTRSRNRDEEVVEARVREEIATPAEEEAIEPVDEEIPEAQNPRFRHLRIAELAGQLAYKRKFCDGGAVFNRDYNEYLESVPEDYRDEVKTAYWKGYQRGKRVNQGLTRQHCQS